MVGDEEEGGEEGGGGQPAAGMGVAGTEEASGNLRLCVTSQRDGGVVTIGCRREGRGGAPVGKEEGDPFSVASILAIMTLQMG